MNTQTKESPRLFSNADLRKLILPLVLEQTLVITVGMVDTMMVLYRAFSDNWARHQNASQH